MQPYSREYWKNLLPVIQAFVDCKDVEFQFGDGPWHLASAPQFGGPCGYRIKPEEPFRLNTYEEAAEILKAISEGKSVEIRGAWCSWRDWEGNWPNFAAYQYRIKGESK